MVMRYTHSRYTRFPGAGRRCDFPKDLLSRIRLFYEARRAKDWGVSVKLLKAEARRVDPVSCASLNPNSFRMRLSRLLRSWDISWRRVTNKSQNTRHAATIQDHFRSYVKHRAKMLGVEAGNIYNCDETNVYYSMEPNYTYATKGSRTVSIKGCDSSNRVSVMLAAGWLANKLPPYIVYKGSSNRTGRICQELIRKVSYPVDCEVNVNERAWFNEATMLDWIDTIWIPFAVKDGSKVLYLLLDSCTVHMTASVREKFVQCNTEIDFIPPGYTSKLQMLDVGVNKPFKDRIKTNFDDWLVTQCGDDLNANPKPKRQDVAHWIVESWKDINDDIFTNSWRRSMGNLMDREQLINDDEDDRDFLALID